MGILTTFLLTNSHEFFVEFSMFYIPTCLVVSLFRLSSQVQYTLPSQKDFLPLASDSGQSSWGRQLFTHKSGTQGTLNFSRVLLFFSLLTSPLVWYHLFSTAVRTPTTIPPPLPPSPYHLALRRQLASKLHFRNASALVWLAAVAPRAGLTCTLV